MNLVTAACKPAFLKSAAVFLSILMVTPAWSAAPSAFWQGRASISLGQYDTDGRDNSGSLSADGNIVGLDLGGSFGANFWKADALGALLFDIELDFLTVGSIDLTLRDSNGNVVGSTSGDDFDRTDLKFTVGQQFSLGLVPFIGYRIAYQGDGLLDDENYQEKGIVLGLAYSGIELGKAAKLGLSVAYNDDELEFDNGATVDVTGYSARATVNLTGVPLGFSLKYQTFEDDRSIIRENYLTASMTWYFLRGFAK